MKVLTTSQIQQPAGMIRMQPSMTEFAVDQSLLTATFTTSHVTTPKTDGMGNNQIVDVQSFLPPIICRTWEARMNRPCQKTYSPKFSWVLVHHVPLRRTEPLFSLSSRTDVLEKIGDNEHFGGESRSSLLCRYKEIQCHRDRKSLPHLSCLQHFQPPLSHHSGSGGKQFLPQTLKQHTIT